ncbi:hypothetical protein BDW59DRAFT_174473 [Aspergillus cavernicola]|uniref:FabD/lysophospholipase-like protein n=1 Tax=Aspergillus cavernicola TaxID=176166 RepID=A0ABR4I0Q5_9EURO
MANAEEHWVNPTQNRIPRCLVPGREIWAGVEPGSVSAPSEEEIHSAFDSLSIFEDPSEDTLIELSPAQPVRTTGNLLDIDDITMVPPVFRDQMMAVMGPLLPLSAENSESEDYGDPVNSYKPLKIEPEPEERCYCGFLPANNEHCYFCYPCGHVFCDRCWARSPPHVRQRVQRGIPHEKTDPRLAKIIEQTLEIELDEKAQALMHLNDENSSWFGTLRDDDDDMVFHDHGRYADLMAEMSARKRQLRYPGLVSFVGQTGAGKSTVVKLLIEIQVPVVGSTTNQDLPTSADVHLYADPVSWSTDTPLLYADCEGLDGGEREPMGVKMRKVKKRLVGHSVPNHFRMNARHNTTTRDLLWATSERTKSREYIVRNLYPRLLYTFSDTIVFVTKNPRVVENVVDQLIAWATAALEKSSNQPVLPHAIIVLNAAENNTDPRLWDIDESTQHLMESMNEAIERNHNLRARVEFWAPRQRRITSIRELLLSYYSDIRVVRVPERGRPKLINQQIERLYQEVKVACQKSREVKHKLRMRLNSDELQPYLQHAFDHFSRDLEMPFDFVQASFANSPIPSDFGGNILKLAINILDQWRDRLDGPSIFKELSYIVASAVMLDSARRKTLGPAESVFREYLDQFDDSLDDFCDRHWPCEYVSAEGRCVNVRSGHHAKGHQLKSGRVIAIAEYESSFSADGFRSTFRSLIFDNIAALLRKLFDATRDAADRELEEAATIHRDLVLKQFFHHLGGPAKFISHTVCYACLVEPPEHLLPCGHVLCTPCIKTFGMNRGKNAYEMLSCPIHLDRTEGQCPHFWPISIKPQGAGTRILSLDGGGIRGIVELTILQQIEKALGPGLYIQDFFDLIVGTSTGGIIALGLGARGLSVQESIYEFRRLCKKAFTRRKGAGIPGLERIITASNHSKYETRPFEDALKSIYEENRLFGGSRHNMEPSCLRRLTKSYRFYRSERPENEVKIWEAARATSAAPRIFKPFFHSPSGQEYQDGAIYHNNPIDIAIREQKLIWPDTAESHPDIVLSIGTGYNPESQAQEDPQQQLLSTKPTSRGMISYFKGLARIAIDHIHSSLDSERTWHTFLERSHPQARFRDRYIRANLALENDPPSLDDVSMIDTLSEMTRSRVTKEFSLIQAIADRLIASTFYFEESSSPAGITIENDDGTFTVKGTILSRFPRGSAQIHCLGEAFHQRSKNMFNRGIGRYHQPYFVVRERRRERDGSVYMIDEAVIQSMNAHGIFSMPKFEFRVAQRMAETEISLCLDGDQNQPKFYPISGFPRCLLEGNMAWVSRSRSSNQPRSREQWRGPYPSQPSDPRLVNINPIDHYTDTSYQYPGDETYDSLVSRKAELLVVAEEDMNGKKEKFFGSEAPKSSGVSGWITYLNHGYRIGSYQCLAPHTKQLTFGASGTSYLPYSCVVEY